MTWDKMATGIATMGGLGRAPIAPGTWGSAVGLVIGVAVVRIASRPLSLLLLAATFIACALICTQAARALDHHDPSSVILDEVWGMAAIVVAFPDVCASGRGLVLAFLLFRLFDIVKPFPVRRLERLPAGWGIMADDLGAAAYAGVLLWFATKSIVHSP